MIPYRLLGVIAAVLCMMFGTGARAEPRWLAGVAYEEVTRGETTGGEPPPVLVAFHYSGGSAIESFTNYDQVSGPVRILVPLGRHPKRGGLSYFPVDYYQRSPKEQFLAARETATEMARFLEAVEALYGRRPVVSGISQGGDISFLLAVYHPDTVAAAVPLAAVIPDALLVSPDRARRPGPCILMMQGEDDAIVDVSRTRARVASLRGDLPVGLATYAGLGHDISLAMKTDYTAFIDTALRHAQLAARTPQACGFPS
ncbi:alpha/beta hydrolase [Caulobacter sp. UNC358MFTsu5.1]|uniref:alpha/beta hydrolase n=1 Tax=Caulobacter sp. UNC358MFTsu5.1 TaxID=1449049 RepID=UPI0004A76900|nr:hypothetical protein [Caulobacter sp. UNC358MFTsu5.1]